MFSMTRMRFCHRMSSVILLLSRRYRSPKQETIMKMSSIRSFRQALGMAGIATLALGASLAATPAANQTGTSIMTMKQDLADREKDIHWSQEFDPSVADLFSHNALLINASCERICGPLSTRRSGRSGQTNSSLN